MNITAEEKLNELIKDVDKMVEIYLEIAEEDLNFCRKNNLAIKSAMDEGAKLHSIKIKNRWDDIKYQYEK